MSNYDDLFFMTKLRTEVTIAPSSLGINIDHEIRLSAVAKLQGTCYDSLGYISEVKDVRKTKECYIKPEDSSSSIVLGVDVDVKVCNPIIRSKIYVAIDKVTPKFIITYLLSTQQLQRTICPLVVLLEQEYLTDVFKDSDNVYHYKPNGGEAIEAKKTFAKVEVRDKHITHNSRTFVISGILLGLVSKEEYDTYINYITENGVPITPEEMKKIDIPRYNLESSDSESIGSESSTSSPPSSSPASPTLKADSSVLKFQPSYVKPKASYTNTKDNPTRMEFERLSVKKETPKGSPLTIGRPTRASNPMLSKNVKGRGDLDTPEEFGGSEGSEESGEEGEFLNDDEENQELQDRDQNKMISLVLLERERAFKSSKITQAGDLFAKNPKPVISLEYLPKLSGLRHQLSKNTNWEKNIKPILTELEMIDSYKNNKVLAHSYNKPVIDYEVMDNQVFSKSYFKLWEILTSLDLFSSPQEKQLTVAFLAEGPGGFIQAFADYRKKYNEGHIPDNLVAITMKIDAQNLGKGADWSYKKATEYFDKLTKSGVDLKLSYGQDNIGNLLKKSNMDFFAKNDLKEKKCQLVTADGSIDFGDENTQEISNAPIFFSEIITCFKIQEKGGVFILKIYDIMYDITLQMILLLHLLYQKVSILKPESSKKLSSEKFIVCEGFKGIFSAQMTTLEETLKTWLEGAEINSFAQMRDIKPADSLLEFDLTRTYYKQLTSKIATFNRILSNQQLSLFETGEDLLKRPQISKNVLLKTKNFQRESAIKWCRKYNIPYDKNTPLTTVYDS